MAKVELDLDLITKEMDTLKDDRARLKFELNNVEKEIENENYSLSLYYLKQGLNQWTMAFIHLA